MASADSSEILVQNLSTALRLSKLLGLVQITYNKDKRNFEQSAILSRYSCFIRTLWCFTPILISYFAYLQLTSLDIFCKRARKAELQRRVICMLNIVLFWCAVSAMFFINARSTTSLYSNLNAIIRYNRRLLRLIKRDALTSRRFHTFTVLRIILTIVDVYLIFNRPMLFYITVIEFEWLIVSHRLVMMATFFEWHAIETYLMAAMHALHRYMRRNEYNLRPRDYEKLSMLYTRLFRLQQATYRYYQPFVLVTCAGLFRTVVMGLHTFQALFLTRLRNTPLESTVVTFKYFMVPGITSTLDFVLICIMAEFLSTSAEVYRWMFLMRSLKSNGGECVRRAVETVLRQSAWERMRWVLVSGHSVSRRMCFSMLNAAISLTIVFLIYDSGNSVLGENLLNESDRPMSRLECYVLIFVTTLGVLACNRIVAWCMKSVSYRV